MNPNIRDHAAKGGRATAAKKLNLARIEREVPPMDSPANVKLRLEMLTNWAAAGMLPGVVAGACIARAVVSRTRSAMGPKMVRESGERERRQMGLSSSFAPGTN